MPSTAPSAHAPFDALCARHIAADDYFLLFTDAATIIRFDYHFSFSPFHFHDASAISRDIYAFAAKRKMRARSLRVLSCRAAPAAAVPRGMRRRRATLCFRSSFPRLSRRLSSFSIRAGYTIPFFAGAMFCAADTASACRRDDAHADASVAADAAPAAPRHCLPSHFFSRLPLSLIFAGWLPYAFLFSAASASLSASRLLHDIIFDISLMPFLFTVFATSAFFFACCALFSSLS